MSIRRFIVQKVIRPKWVAFQYPDNPKSYELGISIFGIVFGLYKADTIYPSSPINVRRPEKREFGESLHPVAN